MTTNLVKKAGSCGESRQHPEVEDVLQSNGPEHSTAACKGHTFGEGEKKTRVINRWLLKVN